MIMQNQYKRLQKKGDEKLFIQIRSLTQFSVEAHYHPSCRKAFTGSIGGYQK